MKLLLRNDLAEIDRLAAAIESFCGERAVPPEAAFHLNLVLEELFTNIVNYSYGERTDDGVEAAHDIAVYLERHPDGIAVEVVDDGHPFDPMSVPSPDIDAALEERPVGGLGVHFLRTLMQDIRYHRQDGCNYLSFRKALAERDPAS